MEDLTNKEIEHIQIFAICVILFSFWQFSQSQVALHGGQNVLRCSHLRILTTGWNLDDYLLRNIVRMAAVPACTYLWTIISAIYPPFMCIVEHFGNILAKKKRYKVVNLVARQILPYCSAFTKPFTIESLLNFSVYSVSKYFWEGPKCHQEDSTNTSTTFVLSPYLTKRFINSNSLEIDSQLFWILLL